MKRTTKPKEKQVWSVSLTMRLGDETTEVKRDIDLGGDARDVLDAIYGVTDEVEEAVKSAARTILVSARGFGVKRGGGK